MTTIIINEQHTLLPQQLELLTERFGAWETIRVPSDGWNLQQQIDIAKRLDGEVVFISPVPVLIALAAEDAALNFMYEQCRCEYPYTPAARSTIKKAWIMAMANDQREKKELPNGKVISVTAQNGWYLV